MSKYSILFEQQALTAEMQLILCQSERAKPELPGEYEGRLPKLQQREALPVTRRSFGSAREILDLDLTRSVREM